MAYGALEVQILRNGEWLTLTTIERQRDARGNTESDESMRKRAHDMKTAWEANYYLSMNENVSLRIA